MEARGDSVAPGARAVMQMARSVIGCRAEDDGCVRSASTLIRSTIPVPVCTSTGCRYEVHG